jgi:hypothetical protein
MLVKDGTYQAVAREASVYFNLGGSLVCAFNFQLESGEYIKGYSTLAKSDGTVNTKSIDNLKDVFGWDGQDPFWLVENDLSGVPVQLVIENVSGRDDPTKTYSQVKWINKPGGGSGAMPEAGDRKAILAKFGSKFRALAGGSPVKPKAPPTAPPAASAPPTKAPPTKEPVSTQEKCWNAICEAHKDESREDIEKAWFEAIGDRDPEKFTPKDWGKLELFITDNVPY